MISRRVLFSLGILLVSLLFAIINSLTSIHLQVEVNDPTNSLNSFKESFEIAVGDSNDHAPKFDRGTYTASLEESSEPGTSVLTVRATDKDDGENGRLRYSLRYAPDRTLPLDQRNIGSFEYVTQ